MRDPLSRKLFQSRDAREKLRGMGGIVASSPALAETVARFNNGGDITVPVVGPEFTPTQEPAVVTYGGAEFAVLPDGSVVNTLSNQPVTDAQDPGGILRRTIQNLATRDIPNPVDEFSGLLPYMTEQAGTVETPEDISIERTLDDLGFGPALAPVRGRREEAELQEAAAAATERAILPQMEREMLERAAREEGLVAKERRRAVTGAQMEAEAEADDRESMSFRLRQAQQRAAEELAGKTDDGDGGGGGFDFDTTYAQMLERVGRVMREGAKKDDREKAMANLAMIGLAIAAGQSPNALTNIAQGALIGMKGIQEAEAAETAREREMRLEALRLASSEVELNRRLESAEKIAAMRDSGGTYTPERLRQQNMSAILSNPDMFDVFTGNTVDPDKVTALAERLSQRGLSLGGAGGQQFTPGQLVTQDGVTYEYQQDGSWEPVVGE